MPRVYELPTHLQVEDVLLVGLTARQLLRLMVGASLAYGFWDQASGLPPEVRTVLAAALAVAGLLLALVQPGGRPLDQWLFAAMLFALLPRRLLWRPGASELPGGTREPLGWAELSPRPEWVASEVDETLETEHVSTRRFAWWRWRR